MPKSTYYYEISKVDTVDFRNIELTGRNQENI